MTKSVYQNLLAIATVTVACILGSIIYPFYDGYIKSTAKSSFESAASQMGFNGYTKTNGQVISAAQHQEALLKVFYLAGYFQPSKLWQNINCLQLIDPVSVFIQTYRVLRKSYADQTDSNKFNAKVLRKNLGKETELNREDLMTLLLHISSHAFAREVDKSQERNEICAQDWMIYHAQEYLTAAEILGLIDREIPVRSEYDSVWIAGGARIAMLARLIDYHYNLSKYGIKVNANGETLVLTGERELWAEMDGVTPKVRDKLMEAVAVAVTTNVHVLDVDKLAAYLVTQVEVEASVEEGKEYIVELASRSGILLNESCPWITYTTKEECPRGRFPGRTYPNYADGESSSSSRKLTETLMTKDIISSFSLDNTGAISIMNTLVDDDHQRPNTASTSHDAAERFVEQIIQDEYGAQKEFIILLQTNNPYIERQTLVTQHEVDKVLKCYKLDESGYKIQIEGVGYGCKQRIAVIHSELAALVQEKWKDANAKDADHQIMQNLQNWPKSNANFHLHSMLPLPNISEINQISGNFFQDIFDKYLP